MINVDPKKLQKLIPVIFKHTMNPKSLKRDMNTDTWASLILAVVWTWWSILASSPPPCSPLTSHWKLLSIKSSQLWEQCQWKWTFRGTKAKRCWMKYCTLPRNWLISIQGEILDAVLPHMPFPQPSTPLQHMERRAPAPPIPFPPKEENMEKLEEFQKQYYFTSTFNTCSHKPLLLFRGPPLELAISQGSKPVCVQTPCIIPRHTLCWEKTGKRGIDRDVELGVLECVTRHKEWW